MPVSCRPAACAVGLVAVLLSCGFARLARADDGRTRFGLAAGVLVPTALHVGGKTQTAEPGPILLIGFDRPVGRDLPFEYGGFLDVGSFTAGGTQEQVNLLQLGLSGFWDLPGTWGGLLRFGGRVGYRHLFADGHAFDGVRGAAVDLVGQFIKEVSKNFVGQIEVGLLTEPIGGNSRGLVFFGPFPAIAIGMCF